MRRGRNAPDRKTIAGAQRPAERSRPVRHKIAGASAAQLGKEFELSIDDYLKACEERGRTPDKPFSGKIPLRIPPELHRAASAAAKARGKSLSAWIAETVEEAAGKTLG